MCLVMGSAHLRVSHDFSVPLAYTAAPPIWSRHVVFLFFLSKEPCGGHFDGPGLCQEHPEWIRVLLSAGSAPWYSQTIALLEFILRSFTSQWTAASERCEGNSCPEITLSALHHNTAVDTDLCQELRGLWSPSPPPVLQPQVHPSIHPQITWLMSMKG